MGFGKLKKAQHLKEEAMSNCASGIRYYVSEIPRVIAFYEEPYPAGNASPIRRV
jgi:hypothetical protein